MTNVATVNDLVTVQQAAALLGIKRGSVRKAYRAGLIEGQRWGDPAQPNWSFLMLTRASVEEYRKVHLGTRRPGPPCEVCGARRYRHGRGQADHSYAAKEAPAS